MYDAAREIGNIRTVAAKEFMDNLLSKRFIVIGVFYLGLALVLVFLAWSEFYSFARYLSDPSLDAMSQAYVKSMIEAFKPEQVLSSLNYLNLVLALLAVFASADTISMEKKDRTIYQLASKPVERSSIVAGKFLGCLGVVTSLFLGCALLAYALTSVVTGRYPAPGDLPAAAAAILSMVPLLAVYVAIGVLISALTKNPIISIVGSVAVCLGLWLAGKIGDIHGQLSLPDPAAVAGDPFNSFPLYDKAMIWIDPIHHGIVTQLLAADPAAQVAAGMPLWANVVFVVAYTGALLALAIAVFSNQDISV